MGVESGPDPDPERVRRACVVLAYFGLAWDGSAPQSDPLGKVKGGRAGRKGHRKGLESKEGDGKGESRVVYWIVGNVHA